jgi:ribosome maturation factor RimP
MQQFDHDQFIADVRHRVAALGYELADLKIGGARTRPRFQVRIDRPDSRPGHGITVDDCATVSRALETWLDEAGLFGPRYILEVSSPGIERPVRWREHWERFVGHDVRVRLPGRGRIRARIVRVVEAGDAVVLRPRDEADDLTVPLADVRDARLAVDWEPSGLHLK